MFLTSRKILIIFSIISIIRELTLISIFIGRSKIAGVASAWLAVSTVRGNARHGYYIRGVDGCVRAQYEGMHTRPTNRQVRVLSPIRFLRHSCTCRMYTPIQILWYPCVSSCLRYCALRHRSFIDHTELEENFRNAISELFIPNER